MISTLLSGFTAIPDEHRAPEGVVHPQAAVGRAYTNEPKHTNKGWAREATRGVRLAGAPCSSYLRRRLSPSAGALGGEPKNATRSLHDESGNSAT